MGSRFSALLSLLINKHVVVGITSCGTIPVGGYLCTLTSSSSYGNYIVAFIYDCTTTRFSDASGVSYSYPMHILLHRVRREHFFPHYFDDTSCVYVGVPVESWFMDDSDSHSWNHYCTGSCQLIEIRRMRMMSDYQD